MALDCRMIRRRAWSVDKLIPLFPSRNSAFASGAFPYLKLVLGSMMAESQRRGGDVRAQAFEEWNRAEVDTAKVAIPPPQATILDECPRFRILIIGRTGVGKSTICKNVFGIKDYRITGVSHHSRGIHNVEDEITFPDINPRVGIHDAPGFEAGDNRIYETVKAFIKDRRSKDKLADQVHCIWYCISCEDLSRTSQECEEDFFGNLQEIAGKIPVIVVFTKFDQVINAARGKYTGKNFRKIQTGEISEEEMVEDVRKMANANYENGRRVIAKVIDSIRVGIIRTSNPEEDETDDGLLAICPDIGVEPLTRMTFDHLENHGIRILWAAAQNNSADLKLKSSVRLGMKVFGVNLGLSAIPIIPVVSAAAFWISFTHCFDEISRVWKLKDRSCLLQKSSTRRRFLQAIFDVNPWGFLALQAIDLLGAADAPATASVLAKVIAGITLIHDSLFVRELKQRRDGQQITSLTSEDINLAVETFRTGDLRKVMRSQIVGQSLFTKAYSKRQVQDLISNAIETARKTHPRESLERAQSSESAQRISSSESTQWAGL